MIDFNRLIESHLHREVKPKEAGRYYPSDIGNCIRKIWYTYKKPKETEADLVKIFQMGNMIHDFIADVIRSEKNPHVELLKSEVPFQVPVDDFIISGRIDDILLVRTSGKTVLVEVKSTKMLDMVKEANYAHVVQLQVYLHYLKLQHGIIVYVEKNNLHTKSFTIEYDPKIAEEALQRFRRLHLAVISGEIPEPEARLSRDRMWECNYCAWKEECWGYQDSISLKDPR